MQELNLICPDDWHLHLRDGANMASVLPDSARRFGRAIVMPNLKPPVTTVDLAAAYRDRIVAALEPSSAFQPLMTLYLTDNTTVSEIEKAKSSGFVQAVKYYPAGATTHSENGVTDLKRVYNVLEAMEKMDLPLLLHGEVTDPDIDIFDREAVFIERHLLPLTRNFPGLRMVLEHITTRTATQFVADAGKQIAATITAHHLLLNRNALFVGGVRPHHYCLPILKRETHRQALIQAATSGNPKYFLGTDSAPHPRQDKESACGCAGIYTAHAAIELYAEVFEAAGALDRLEAFASFHGPDFYQLPRNQGHITLEKRSWTVPESYPCGVDTLIPLRTGEELSWKLRE
ncbi:MULTISPECIES: dihydroorotase [Acidithiobacillus]|uniref:Dihydroorotase n=3 Tax=Acidithiobacillus thiooxidans TaxID=930 RepID=A0A1C2IY67_ACITH|nr:MULTISPECIES: dihydroorotase [Acidithiobacillus]MBU2740865.1 dihydroorotase [Acidithiobacillus albertensis]MDA8176360.1 dihydroorotase [Acidithiobacillus sp.]OCX74493.1 dihydroorotase [Acidithiobacillus thiooxidans]OCX80920.1 dihydroorotase [Acidithiobacillus thiooxidans]QFX95546.1 dihydroorotase [Acidithiobacillus thiooxidans ATCC 19377]